ncbi:hypothetical protein AB9F29_03495 [Falsihalocynthiibacter sp. S25ZX9]|uniref:hypothetical protein n=1 Tax=Falsihalocynthiibacter sp. S25ZX9 TaxID=3240870 RepID=UPI00350F5F00
MKWKFLANFPAGLFFGWCAANIYWICINDFVRDVGLKYWMYGVSATITLAASGLAVLGVLSGIENQQVINTENRAKKLLAERAFLPLALSRLTEVCQVGLDYSLNLDAMITDSSRSEVLKDVEQNLVLSDETVATLKAVLEHSDDEMVCRHISVVLKEYQIFRARLLGRVSDEIMIHTEGNIKESVISWVYLQALVGRVFDYARGEIVGQIVPLDLRAFESAIGSVWWSQNAARTVRFNSVEEQVTSFAKKYVKIFH